MEGSFKFPDLGKRVVTAAIIIGVLVVLEFLSQAHPEINSVYALVAFAVVALCAYEYVKLCETFSSSLKIASFIVLLLPSFFILIKSFYNPIAIVETTAPGVLAASLGGFAFVLGILVLAGRTSLDAVKAISTELLLGMLLIGCGGAGLVSLSSLQSHALLYWIIFVVCANDIGAYFIGVAYGVTKLSPSLSPGKSVEGTLAGILCALIVGFLLAFLKGYKSFPDMVGAVVVVAMIGQLFDLSKSFIKRMAQVKDSGNLLPGHGGILDRLDGILGGSLAIHIWNLLF